MYSRVTVSHTLARPRQWTLAESSMSRNVSRVLLVLLYSANELIAPNVSAKEVFFRYYAAARLLAGTQLGSNSSSCVAYANTCSTSEYEEM